MSAKREAGTSLRRAPPGGLQLRLAAYAPPRHRGGHRAGMLLGAGSRAEPVRSGEGHAPDVPVSIASNLAFKHYRDRGGDAPLDETVSTPESGNSIEISSAVASAIA